MAEVVFTVSDAEWKHVVISLNDAAMEKTAVKQTPSSDNVHIAGGKTRRSNKTIRPSSWVKTAISDVLICGRIVAKSELMQLIFKL